MKKNVLGLAAVVLAVVASSFTVKKVQDVYAVYNSGAQSSISSYTIASSDVARTGNAVLAWIKFEDDNGIVTQTEFTPVFDELNTTSSTPQTLNDETEKTSVSGYVLEKKNP